MTPFRVLVLIQIVAVALVVGGVAVAWIVGLTGSLYAHG